MTSLKQRSLTSSTQTVEKSSINNNSRVNDKVDERSKFFSLTSLHQEFFIDNPYLSHKFFRKMPSYSYHLSFSSCYDSFHNDTLNIYTHLIAALFYNYLVYLTIFSNNSLGTLSDSIIFFIIGNFVSLCFYGSSAYHIFRNHSLESFQIFLMIDLSGIAVVIGCANFLAGYYEFFCYPLLKYFYLTLNFMFLFYTLWYIPKIVLHRLGSLRTLLFCIFSVGSIFPVVFRSYLEDTWDQRATFSSLHVIYAYIFLGSGLVVRTVKLPERAWIGRFDLVGASHQIFHCLVGIAPYFIYASYYQVAVEVFHTSLC